MASLFFLPQWTGRAVLQAGNGNGPARSGAWYLSGSCHPVLRLVCNFFQTMPQHEFMEE